MNPSTLKSAARTAILHGNTIADIRASAWAATYHCDTDAVRIAFEQAHTELSRIPVGYEGDGK